MRKNILYGKRKIRFDGGGPLGGITGVQTIPQDFINSKVAGIDTTMIQNGKQGPGFMQKGGGMDNLSGAIGVANAGIQGFMTGSKNNNTGLRDTIVGTNNSIEEMANGVSNTYTAGSGLNLMKKNDDGFKTAKDFKTHKGWKNVLGSTAAGALAGAKMGGAWSAAIGGAVGLIGAGVGEFFGWRKRKKQAEEANRAKLEADYSVDYYNSKQAEQLASANDNAAHSTANQNRYSIFGLMARGGRRNLLINNKHKRLC